MNVRFGTSSVGSLLVTTALGFSQQGMRAMPIPGPVRDAGVYHLATGTWSRGSDHENLGAKILYSNTANTGFYGIMGAPCDIVWTDEGRIPSTSGHPNAKADAYAVQSIEIAYCSGFVGGYQTGSLEFYDSYSSCTNPTGPTVQSLSFSVPAYGCWIATFDLQGTSFEFRLHGDADGTFDGTTALDNFGWTITLHDLGTGGFNGPLLNGDPNNFPYGDGTYFQNPGATYATGLDTVDQFWLSDSMGCYPNGCYWIGGGYFAGNPFASFWLELGGSHDGRPGWQSYCTSLSNSTGFPALLSATGSSAAAGDIELSSLPVPDQPGIFFHGPSQAFLAFGNGNKCVGGQLVRGALVVASGNIATYLYSNSDAKHSLLPFVGQLRHFQHWFRDPAAGGAAFDLSNGLMGIVP